MTTIFVLAIGVLLVLGLGSTNTYRQSPKSKYMKTKSSYQKGLDFL